MKRVETSGSVRVDLLGGTLDLNPICVILPQVVTLNLATQLKAKVVLSGSDRAGIEIESIDYGTKQFWPQAQMSAKNLASEHFGPFKFVLQVLDYFNIHHNIALKLESGSPPGAGLGGSSAMGVTLYKALCQWCDSNFDCHSAIRVVGAIEARILNSGPAGYQDYYPALYGGILGLVPELGEVQVRQLYSPELCQVLEENITLVYSGQTRLSGINNWEVYKAFFDGDEQVRQGLGKIAKLSYQALSAVVEKDFAQLPKLIAQEGAVRQLLFPGIVSSPMEILYNELKAQVGALGMKVCGAGGGGCFLLTHPAQYKSLVVQKIASHAEMQILDFKVAAPL